MRIWTLIPTLTLFACAAEAAPEPPPATPGPAPVILVSMDTLRADRLVTYGGKKSLMPNLDRFAGESIVFDTAFSQSNETLFSHASLLTSRYPSEMGTIDYDFRMPTDVPSLQSVLGTYGWKTGAVVSGAFMSEAFGMNAGFGHFEVAKDWGSLWHSGPRALAWIDEARKGTQPWMVLVHTYDMHARYLKPPPFGSMWGDRTYQGPARMLSHDTVGTERIADGAVWEAPSGSAIFDMFANGVRERTEDGGFRHRMTPDARMLHPLDAADVAYMAATYDGAATYLDTMFGLFLAQLEKRGVLDEAVIVVFADHGEELGERGVFNHRWGLSEQVAHVPLMIRLPGGRNGGQHVQGIVELTDVTPTVLALAGATPPAGARGTTLLDAQGNVVPPTREVAFTEATCRAVGARGKDGLLVFSGMGPDSPWIAEGIAAAPIDGPWFDATTLAPGHAGELRDKMVAWRKSLPPPRGPSNAKVDESLKKALREKGYWEAQ
jgi:hypothetical protein